MEGYEIITKIGEGAHGIVWKAKNKETNELCALKKIQLKRINDDLPVTAIREVRALQQVDHENVIKLMEYFTYETGYVLIFEFMSSDLSTILKETSISESALKRYMIMLLKGIKHCHKLEIMHRDLKPANLLISTDGLLKIADFGLARLFFPDQSRLYSHQVATRWYRAPELLYGAKKYDKGVDIWAIGCIFAEMLNNSPMFPGENDIEQLCLVMKTLGTPTEESWPSLKDLPDYNKITFPTSNPVPFEDLSPDASSTAIALLKQFLLYESSHRIAAHQALMDRYFFTEPLPCDQHNLPIPSERLHTDMASHELNHSTPLEKTLVHPNELKDCIHIWM